MMEDNQEAPLSDEQEDMWVAAEAAHGECGSCEPGVDDVSDTPACSESRRPCGHHCNHVWTHDECDWCGAVFGPNDEEPTYRPAST